jgi:hypothetical protein
MMARMHHTSATNGSAWRRRVEEFERDRRRPLKSVAIFAAFHVLFFIAITMFAALALDMDGHDPLEEPIRSFLFRSIRTLVLTVLPIPQLTRVAPTMAGILALAVFLGSALAFGVLATIVTRRFSSARRSR